MKLYENYIEDEKLRKKVFEEYNNFMKKYELSYIPVFNQAIYTIYSINDYTDFSIDLDDAQIVHGYNKLSM